MTKYGSISVGGPVDKHKILCEKIENFFDENCRSMKDVEFARKFAWFLAEAGEHDLAIKIANKAQDVEYFSIRNPFFSV